MRTPSSFPIHKGFIKLRSVRPSPAASPRLLLPASSSPPPSRRRRKAGYRTLARERPFRMRFGAFGSSSSGGDDGLFRRRKEVRRNHVASGDTRGVLCACTCLPFCLSSRGAFWRLVSWPCLSQILSLKDRDFWSAGRNLRSPGWSLT